MIRSVWRYRHFITASVVAELRSRFARSKLGLFWSILHPLAQSTIYAVVLSEFLSAKLHGIDDKAAYSIYLIAGMAGWNLFLEIFNRCLTVFVEYSGALKKIVFPRICLPIIVWGGALVNHILLLLAACVVFLFFGHAPQLTWLVIPIGVILVSMFAFGLGLLLGVFNVFVRDVGQAVAVVLQIWFWLTPIVYTIETVPPQVRWLVELNPVTPLVRIYQDALLFQRWPHLENLIYPTAVSVALMCLAFFVFKRANSEMVDEL
jgi:lipopolysaccharide transport system permease protein